MISTPNQSSWAVSTEIPEQNPIQVPNLNITLPPHNQPSQTSTGVSIAILWDIENCPVPSDVRPEDVAGNIRMALRVHPIIQGAVKMFSAYGDFNAFPRRVREGCQRTGVKLIDVPNGRKDAADKAILVDMFLFALDNSPPSFIMLISGDVDFAPALHILGQRGYTVILVIPSGVGVSSALCNAGRFVWDWPSVARGEGFVPLTKPSTGPHRGVSDVTGFLTGCQINDNNTDGNEEEAIVYRGISQSYYNSRDFSIISQSVAAEYSGCYSAIVGSSASIDKNDSNWGVQPGDITSLKGQLVKLLELSGGCLSLARVPQEYQKVFGRPLYVSDYGAFKIVNLIKKMSDVLFIDGKGQKKFVYLRNAKASHCTPLIPQKKDKKGKEVEESNMEVDLLCGSLDEFSDEVKMVNYEVDGNFGTKLLKFKHELEEILVSYSCRIFLNYFEAIYEQRYKERLEYHKFGVTTLEELLEKMKDVAVLNEEPVTKRKFLSPVLG